MRRDRICDAMPICDAEHQRCGVMPKLNNHPLSIMYSPVSVSSFDNYKSPRHGLPLELSISKHSISISKEKTPPCFI